MSRPMTIHWEAVAQYFTVELIVFRLSSACNFGKFDNFGFCIMRSERVKKVKAHYYLAQGLTLRVKVG